MRVELCKPTLSCRWGDDLRGYSAAKYLSTEKLSATLPCRTSDYALLHGINVEHCSTARSVNTTGRRWHHHAFMPDAHSFRQHAEDEGGLSTHIRGNQLA